MTLSLIHSLSESVIESVLILVSSEHYNDYNDYNDNNDNNNYDDYRDSDWDLDLDWERFSDLVTVTTFTITDKLRDLNHDNEG